MCWQCGRTCYVWRATNYENEFGTNFLRGNFGKKICEKFSKRGPVFVWMAFRTKFFPRIFFCLTSLRWDPNAVMRACPLAKARLKPNCSNLATSPLGCQATDAAGIAPIILKKPGIGDLNLTRPICPIRLVPDALVLGWARLPSRVSRWRDA